MGLTPEPGQKEATLDDVVEQLRRIADVLEIRQGMCGETKDGARCALQASPLHKGYHTTADGQTRWLEEE